MSLGPRWAGVKGIIVVRGWARERDAAPHLFLLSDNPPRWQRVTSCRSSVLYDWSRPVPLCVLGEEPRPSGTAETSAQANTQVKILALAGTCVRRFFKSRHVCFSRTKNKCS